ncbi:hypothetical protein HNY73_014832 [Argiope bruennichi]|uniref:Uncharacterized protein n=1 Tax=Argiope bruennichi TaxID=94029 RepID=A0A8T0EUM0_ARGBR|nr:hypothetical protein HNY73_014832 [Argiope bruennichi]
MSPSRAEVPVASSSSSSSEHKMIPRGGRPRVTGCLLSSGGHEGDVEMSTRPHFIHPYSLTVLSRLSFQMLVDLPLGYWSSLTLCLFAGNKDRI